MSLFIACLLIAGLHMPWWLYPLAVAVWAFHLGWQADLADRLV